jgi:MSHA biogenesis protein MshM
MYLYHYGFKELPFTLTPNTNFYFGLPSHDEAMQVLTTALKTGEGFIKVTGEVGTGKTLLCRKLLNETQDTFEVAYLPNPALSPDEIRFALASELKIRGIGNINQQQLSQKIQLKLLELNSKGKSVLLVIDEAQTIPWDSFEALRLFTNLETESRKLIHVVLFGQPELDQMLKSDRLRQIRQRITFSYKLRTLTLDEVRAYVHHRVRVAGYRGKNLFTPGAIKMLFKYSGGTPRLINVLSHKSLMLTYGLGKSEVDKKQVVFAAKDTESAKGEPLSALSIIFVFSSITLAALCSWYWLWPIIKGQLQ